MDYNVSPTAQRATFTCWSAVTGRHYHNLVTWKDLRADSLVTAWNSSLTMKALRAGGRLLHTITRRPRSDHVILQMLHVHVYMCMCMWHVIPCFWNYLPDH